MGIELFKIVMLILFIVGSSTCLIGLLIELILMIMDEKAIGGKENKWKKKE